MRRYIRDAVSRTSALGHAIANSRSTSATSASLSCARRLRARPKSDQPLPGVAVQFLAIDALGFGGAAGVEQHRAERLPHRGVPAGRLVVGNAVLDRDRFAQRRHRGFVVATGRREFRGDRAFGDPGSKGQGIAIPDGERFHHRIGRQWAQRVEVPLRVVEASWRTAAMPCA